MSKPKYSHILLKLSGEAFAGSKEYGIDTKIINSIAKQVKEVHELGVKIGIVIGGGNIFRGLAASEQGMDRVNADYMGMLATTINGLALRDALEKHGLQARLQTAIEMRKIAEPFIIGKAKRHLDKNRIVIFACGTGSPFFTTDTAAALRAVETNAEVLLKATKVDGVYSKDPIKNSDAEKFESMNYTDILKNNLKVIDSTAASMCRDNNIPIIVFNLKTEGNIKKVILGQKIGTIVSGG